MSKFLITTGLMAMLAFSLVLFMVFAQAYFSPAKAVTISINSVGEAEAEMALLALLVPASVVSSAFILRRMEQREKETYILSALERHKINVTTQE